MDKENIRSAARLRRSAVSERLRIQQEWSALKGPKGNRDNLKQLLKRNENVTRKKKIMKKTNSNLEHPNTMPASNKNSKGIKLNRDCSELLSGCLAIVEVGAETRALALRAALTAMGAKVVSSWRPTITHLIWAEGGCRLTRAKARALASWVVSPLWVEACAAAGHRIPERKFPATSRPSDLPSPKTLLQMLKRAEMENIPLRELLQDSSEEDERLVRLRLSSETDNTSKDTTASPDPMSRVNTEPRAARRKLFTQKEVIESDRGSQQSEEKSAPTAPKQMRSKQRENQRRNLAQAEQLARRFVGATTSQPKNVDDNIFRIVLTGMSRVERPLVHNAVRELNGKVQSHINNRTTHVILGSCVRSNEHNVLRENMNAQNKTMNSPSVLQSPHFKKIVCDISGVTRHRSSDLVCDNNEVPASVATCNIVKSKARTLNALLGAIRGCRIVSSEWVMESLKAKKWICPYAYEIPHLEKISLKARIERKILGLTNAAYAYDVFKGMHVNVKPDTEQRDAAVQLLKLCGAVVTEYSDAQTQSRSQYGVASTADCVITLGRGAGDVCSKWVFDSVAAARTRTVRRFIIN